MRFVVYSYSMRQLWHKYNSKLEYLQMLIIMTNSCLPLQSMLSDIFCLLSFPWRNKNAFIPLIFWKQQFFWIFSANAPWECRNAALNPIECGTELCSPLFEMPIYHLVALSILMDCVRAFNPLSMLVETKCRNTKTLSFFHIHDNFTFRFPTCERQTQIK